MNRTLLPGATELDQVKTDLAKAHPALRRLCADHLPVAREIARFLAANEFPLTEPGAITFVFQGDVVAVHLMRFIDGKAQRLAMKPVRGTDLWFVTTPVAEGARFEYKFDVDFHQQSIWIRDPLNPIIAQDPYGANSVARAYGYEPPEWSEPKDVPSGNIENITLDSTSFGETRLIHIYKPHGFQTSESYPLVIVHDGSDFVRYGDLFTVMDNLIATGDLPPMILALIDSEDRIGDYAVNPAHGDFVARELLPALQERYPLIDTPASRILLGASLGAVASLTTAHWHPGLFGGLVLNSGSFVLDRSLLASRDPVFAKIADFLADYQTAGIAVAQRAFVSCGKFEGLASENAAFAEILQRQGVCVQLNQVWDGHHWRNWRNQLRDALRWVLVETGCRSELE